MEVSTKIIISTNSHKHANLYTMFLEYNFITIAFFQCFSLKTGLYTDQNARSYNSFKGS